MPSSSRFINLKFSVDYKYLNKKLANRKTEVGHWKARGQSRVFKKSLGTNWVILEHHATDDFPNRAREAAEHVIFIDLPTTKIFHAKMSMKGLEWAKTANFTKFFLYSLIHHS